MFKIDKLVRLVDPPDLRGTVWRIIEEPTSDTITVKPVFGMFHQEREHDVKRVSTDVAVPLSIAELGAEKQELERFIRSLAM